MQRFTLTKDLSQKFRNRRQSRLGLTGAALRMLNFLAGSETTSLAGPDAGHLMRARSGFVLATAIHGHRSWVALMVNQLLRLAFPKNIPNMVGS